MKTIGTLKQKNKTHEIMISMTTTGSEIIKYSLAAKSKNMSLSEWVKLAANKELDSSYSENSTEELASSEVKPTEK